MILSFTMLPAVSAALMAASAIQASEPKDAPFAPFDLLAGSDLSTVRAAAERGDVTAIYAMWLATFHGLKGQPRDVIASAQWRSQAIKWGEQTTHTVTRFIPGESRPGSSRCQSA